MHGGSRASLYASILDYSIFPPRVFVIYVLKRSGHIQERLLNALLSFSHAVVNPNNYVEESSIKCVSRCVL